MTLEIDTRTRDDDTIVAELDIPRRLNPYFDSTEFFVRYDSSIADCPESLYPIPVLTTVLPIAWAEGVDVRVDRIDRHFLSSIGDVRAGYERLFGDEVFGGAGGLRADQVDEIRTRTDDGAGLLFSGGVDSLAALVRHRNECSDLFTVHGADVQVSNTRGFERVAARNEVMAEEFGATLHRVQSNFRECLNYLNLNLYYRNTLNRSWWVGIQHGIALPGLCAPVAHIRSLETVYLAASYSQDPDYPTIQPYITNHVNYAGAGTRMAVADLTRQERIGNITDWSENVDSEVYVRSCSHDQDGSNCNECEKCYRTVLGLAAAGADPSAYGYRYDRDVLQSCRSGLKSEEIGLSDVVCRIWKQIQAELDVNTVPQPRGGDCGFFRWFKDVDLNRFAADREVSASRKRMLLQRLPPPVGCRIARLYWKLPVSVLPNQCNRWN